MFYSTYSGDPVQQRKVKCPDSTVIRITEYAVYRRLRHVIPTTYMKFHYQGTKQLKTVKAFTYINCWTVLIGGLNTKRSIFRSITSPINKNFSVSRSMTPYQVDQNQRAMIFRSSMFLHLLNSQNRRLSSI